MRRVLRMLRVWRPALPQSWQCASPAPVAQALSSSARESGARHPQVCVWPREARSTPMCTTARLKRAGDLPGEVGGPSLCRQETGGTAARPLVYLLVEVLAIVVFGFSNKSKVENRQIQFANHKRLAMRGGGPFMFLYLKIETVKKNKPLSPK